MIWSRLVYIEPNSQSLPCKSLQLLVRDTWEEYAVLEFYAGKANITRAMRRGRKKCGRFDFLYDKANLLPGRKRLRKRSSAMDINSPAGLVPLDLSSGLQQSLYIVALLLPSASTICNIIVYWLPRLALVYLMKGKSQSGFLAFFAIKCASWTLINQATSGRSICASTGFRQHESVQQSNTMCARTVGDKC